LGVQDNPKTATKIFRFYFLFDHPLRLVFELIYIIKETINHEKDTPFFLFDHNNVLWLQANWQQGPGPGPGNIKGYFYQIRNFLQRNIF
jgi:hypothetical protein